MEHITFEKVIIVVVAIWAFYKFVNRPNHMTGTQSRGYTNVSPNALSDSEPRETVKKHSSGDESTLGGFSADVGAGGGGD
ncbi:hypothetical protein RA19_01585 [Leisingera sp. ANG-M1]|uniref:hypothetical protein n=1 Tax=Leisingera sp. ANG-M1 TaxID=1577895 RepID=UPI0005837E81|nr:hypothetical protein [Leisingera sp. ANG-M1]KIC12595.1 hypothetical protein RA19_01585 [Leisingera sp. ANG-M1]